MTDKIKIAIVGSRTYTNKNKIKEFIYKLKEEHGKYVEVVSGGARYGADKFAKQIAMEFEMGYKEFPPYHEPYNIYCAEHVGKYGKKYNVQHYFLRNKNLVDYVDAIVAFVKSGKVTNGTKDTINHAKRANKKVVIIS